MAALPGRVISGIGSTVTSDASAQISGSMTSNESNKPVVVLTPEDDVGIKEAMRTAFAILKHIKGLKLPCLQDRQMSCIRPDLFEGGPAWRNAAWESATKTGFILEMSRNSPAVITPLGQWPTGIVSHHSSLEVTEMIDSIRGCLDLKLIQDLEYVEGWGDHGPYYSINQWEGKGLPKPFYREKDELIACEKIKAIWKELAQEFFPKQ